MKIVEDIRPVTYLKTHTADVLEQVNVTHRPMIITQNGEAKAIIQDAESYEKMQAALNMLQLLVQGELDIRQGRTLDQETVFAQLEERLQGEEE